MKITVKLNVKTKISGHELEYPFWCITTELSVFILTTLALHEQMINTPTDKPRLWELVLVLREWLYMEQYIWKTAVAYSLKEFFFGKIVKINVLNSNK